jgi:hypothetical protein
MQGKFFGIAAMVFGLVSFSVPVVGAPTDAGMERRVPNFDNLDSTAATIKKGDFVVITSGSSKNSKGTVTQSSGGKLTIKLCSGTSITVSSGNASLSSGSC